MGTNKKCSACGSVIKDGETYCSFCGMNAEEKRAVDTTSLRQNAASADAERKASAQSSGTSHEARESSEKSGSKKQERSSEASSAQGSKKSWYKLFGIVGAVLLAIVLVWQVAGGAQEEQKYRSEAQAICSDIVKVNREIKQNLDWLGRSTRDQIAERLSDTSDVEAIGKKYTSLKAPSSMEKVHKDLGQLIDNEVKIKTVLKELCQKPAEMSSSEKVAEIKELAKEIDSQCREIPLFEERETLSGIEDKVTRMVRHEKKMRQTFIEEMNAILKSYDTTLRLMNNVQVALLDAGYPGVNAVEYRDGIQGEKQNRELELSRVLKLTVPRDAEEMVKHFETSLVHRIKCCKKMLQVADGRWNGYERDSAIKDAQDMLRASNTEYDIFLNSYDQYKKSVSSLEE